LIDLDFIENIAFIIGSFGLVAWLYFWSRNINSVRHTIQLTELQVRPWVGPVDSGLVLKSTSSEGKEKYIIKIKNFGKTKTKNVNANFIIQDHKFNRESVIDSPNERFDLGPLHPEMEKDFWFYVNSDLIQQATSNHSQIFIGIYMSYESQEDSNGYGIMYQYNNQTDVFDRIETWDD